MAGDPPARTWIRWLKWGLLLLGVLIAVAVAGVIAIVTNDSTDCYADFRSADDAKRVLAKAEAAGVDDTDLLDHQHSASIRLSSDETGADAQEFRRKVKRLVRSGGGHMEKNTPCVERPPFD